VETSDGEPLGKVKGVVEKYFQVDTAGHRDYWLSANLIHSVDGERLVVGVEAEALEPYKLSGPDDGDSAAPSLDDRSDALAGSRQERARRQAMVGGRGREAETREDEGGPHDTEGLSPAEDPRHPGPKTTY
jgi:hypothetical protein